MVSVSRLLLSIPEPIQLEAFCNIEFCILYVEMSVILVMQQEEVYERDALFP